MTSGSVFKRQFNDLEDLLVSARQWDLDFMPLSRDPFVGHLTQVITPDWQVSHACFGSPLRQLGLPPAGFRNLVIPATPCQQFTWRGHAIGGNSLMVFPLGGELESVTAGGFEVYILAIPEVHLEHLCTHLGLPELQSVLGASEVLIADDQAVSRLRWLFRTFVTALTQTSAPLDWCSLSLTLKFTLCAETLLTLHHSAVTARSPRVSARQRNLVQAAESFIRQHARETLRLSELCAELNFSERSLRAAFQHSFGVSPKSFLTLYRLTHVRRDLFHNSSMSAGAVQACAMNWGFWHMGQFARDYKALFGELPSETLRSPRRRQAASRG